MIAFALRHRRGKMMDRIAQGDELLSVRQDDGIIELLAPAVLTRHRSKFPAANFYASSLANSVGEFALFPWQGSWLLEFGLPNPNLVYVVDDDASILKSVARLLRSLGYASLLFPSAEAFANHDDFDKAACILLDIDLGHVSGIELGHRLKAANVAVPIIYMTGNDTPAVREAAHKSGCFAYLTKPFAAAALADNLQRARQVRRK